MYLYMHWKVWSPKVDESGIECSIYFRSKKFNTAEANYTTTERESLVVISCVQKFRPYVLWCKLIIRTNHNTLSFMLRSERLSSKIARWTCLLSEYDFMVKTRYGRAHLNADRLSRCLLPEGSADAMVVAEDEEDEPKVFCLMAHATNGGDDGHQLNHVVARLSIEYDVDNGYRWLMVKLCEESSSELIIHLERFSWTPANGSLMR